MERLAKNKLGAAEIFSKSGNVYAFIIIQLDISVVLPGFVIKNND